MKQLEDYQAEREELVTRRTAELMLHGAEYDPLKLPNFIEALQNASDAQYLTLAVFIGSALQLREGGNEYAVDCGIVAFGNFLRAYWEPLAREQAEQEIPSAEELREDAH